MTISMDGHGPAVLQVTPELRPGTVFLRLAGEMDAATAGHLAEIVRSLPVDHRWRIRLDLADLEFLDASGLTALLRVQALVSDRGGRLSLSRPRPLVLRILDITELTGTFDIDTESPVRGGR